MKLPCYSIHAYTLCLLWIYTLEVRMNDTIYQQCESNIDYFIHEIRFDLLPTIFPLPHYATSATANTTTFIIPTAALYIYTAKTQRSTKIYRVAFPAVVCALETRRRNANKYRQIYPRAFLLHVHFDANATVLYNWNTHTYIISPTLGGCSKYIDSLLCGILCTFCIRVCILCIECMANNSNSITFHKQNCAIFATDVLCVVCFSFMWKVISFTILQNLHCRRLLVNLGQKRWLNIMMPWFMIMVGLE